MDFNKYLNLDVVNKKGEVGTLISVDEKGYIQIKFDNRNAIYPSQAFEKETLTVVDGNIQKEALAEAIAERKQQKIEAKRLAEENKRAQERALRLEDRRTNPNDNVVIRTQICDGGTPDYSNWFKAPCSDALRNYHVKEDKHSTWCNRNSKCRVISTGECPLSSVSNDILCYECQMLLKHEVKAGWDIDNKTGELKKPRSWRLKSDHLVVLMTVEPGQSQNEAIIYSAFISGGCTQADDDSEASATVKDDLYIDLTIEEARKMRFWDYTPATKGKKTTAWGTGLFRYIDDQSAARILLDMVEIIKTRNNELDTERAQRVLTHFLDSYGGTLLSIPPKA